MYSLTLPPQRDEAADCATFSLRLRAVKSLDLGYEHGKGFKKKKEKKKNTKKRKKDNEHVESVLRLLQRFP